MEREITETKTFTHPQLGRIKVEISDLETGFAFRLNYHRASEWTGYRGQAKLDINNGQMLIAHSPFDVLLAPAFTPMLVEVCKPVD
jgi:hypothetical protein